LVVFETHAKGMAVRKASASIGILLARGAPPGAARLLDVVLDERRHAHVEFATVVGRAERTDRHFKLVERGRCRLLGCV